MSSYQAFIDGFPGDNTLYFARPIVVDPSANTVQFAGMLMLPDKDLPHTYRMTLWENNLYVWYNSINVLTITHDGRTDDDLDIYTFTYTIAGPLAL
jgi:hypothetical protein